MKTTRLYTLLALLLMMSTSTDMIIFMLPPEDSFLKMQSYISAKKPRREDSIAISP